MSPSLRHPVRTRGNAQQVLLEFLLFVLVGEVADRMEEVAVVGLGM